VAVVVDTNVPMVASRLTPQANERCVAVCINRLAVIQESGGLLLDDSGHILREYTKNLGHSGQPGAGHAFAKWAHDHQAIAEKVTRVTITPTTDSNLRKYQEFPDHPALKNFDTSDQKFVAVAIANKKKPRILNAVDSDWWDHRDALAIAGVIVEFLCHQQTQLSLPHTRPRPQPRR